MNRTAKLGSTRDVSCPFCVKSLEFSGCLRTLQDRDTDNRTFADLYGTLLKSKQQKLFRRQAKIQKRF